MLQYITLIIAMAATVTYLLYINGPPQRSQSSPSSMADQVHQAARDTTSKLPATGPDGRPLTEGEKKPWSEYGRAVYKAQYERWMPWIEDLYLRWFTRDNKASYATKATLAHAKVTGVAPVDALQDAAHGLAAAPLGPDGLLAPVGSVVGGGRK